jgi:hypothetical protein
MLEIEKRYEIGRVLAVGALPMLIWSQIVVSIVLVRRDDADLTD